MELRPDLELGGTGWSLDRTLEAVGVGAETTPDYSVLPEFTASIGFTMRGCRLRCPFCVVPKKEGKPRVASTIAQIWRGDPLPRDILLLDNDFFGSPSWQPIVDELKAGSYRVSLTQGINARTVTREQAEAVAGLNYRSTKMDKRRLYAAWDSLGDCRRLKKGLERLAEAGVKPEHMMVYMLVGYAKGETHSDREVRRKWLREFGALPYPMPYERTQELRWYQKWVVQAFDKTVTWEDWVQKRAEPRNFTLRPRRSPPGQYRLPLLDDPQECS